MWTCLVTKYTKIDVRGKSFLDSDMANYLNSKQPARSNVTSVTTCSGRKLRDIGLVLPPQIAPKVGQFLIDDFSKSLNFSHVSNKQMKWSWTWSCLQIEKKCSHKSSKMSHFRCASQWRSKICFQAPKKSTLPSLNLMTFRGTKHLKFKASQIGCHLTKQQSLGCLTWWSGLLRSCWWSWKDINSKSSSLPSYPWRLPSTQAWTSRQLVK